MKKHLSKLLVLLPLTFVGGIAFAAYSFTGPTAPPTSSNTDGPLVDTSIDQTKDGGLSVNTFSALHNALVSQDAIFTGTIFGGTPTDPTAPVIIGDTTTSKGVAITGTDSIVGVYQSDSLKTGKGNGQKPLCSTSTGEFYICGTTPPGGPNEALLGPKLVNEPAGVAVVAEVSQKIRNAVNAEVYVQISNGTPITPPPSVSFLGKIKNFYTADATSSNTCSYSTTPVLLAQLTINAGATDSQPYIIDQRCDLNNLTFTIGSYTPHVTSDGIPIVTQ